MPNKKVEIYNPYTHQNPEYPWACDGWIIKGFKQYKSYKVEEYDLIVMRNRDRLLYGIVKHNGEPIYQSMLSYIMVEIMNDLNIIITSG